jgi:hypothetical protein
MAPLPIVNNAIRDSVIELCERALIWRQELPQITVIPPLSTTTTAAAAQYDQSIAVLNCYQFYAGDTITVVLNDTVYPGSGTRWRGKITSVSTTTGPGTIFLDGLLTGAVDAGASVVKLVSEYPMTVPSGTAFAKGLACWLNDNPIDPMSPDDLDNEFNNTSFGWVGVNWRTDVRLPSRWYTTDDGTFNIVLAPNAAGNVRILAALKPSRTSTNFPEWIFERYIETIADGALWRLMIVPKKPYSDKDLAAFHKGKFDGLVGEARARTARGTTRGPLRSHTVFRLR